MKGNSFRKQPEVKLFRKFQVASLAEKQELAQEIFTYGFNGGTPFHYWRVLEVLPKEWMKEHVEGWIRPILKPDDDFGYVQLFTWVENFHPELALQLAHEAIESEYPEVVTAGQEYLQDLENQE